MTNRPISFITASTNYGTMILNHHDFNVNAGSPSGYGLGFELLETGSYCQSDLDICKELLTSRRLYKGDGVVAIDGGANIGVHTLEYAKHMYGWGSVTGYEVQERIFYALAGNVAINNCSNATVKLIALNNYNGFIDVPVPDYNKNASFGSVSLKSTGAEDYGQNPTEKVKIPCITIDSLNLQRLDFMKLDIEGLEVSVLSAAKETIRRCKPAFFIERYENYSEGLEQLLFEQEYFVIYIQGINIVALHYQDPFLEEAKKWAAR